MHHSDKMHMVPVSKRLSHRYERLAILLSVLGLILMTGVYLLLI